MKLRRTRTTLVVFFSGCTETALNSGFGDLKRRPYDPSAVCAPAAMWVTCSRNS